jgi:hypothetical protein
MNSPHLRPAWFPNVVPRSDWTIAHLRKYLVGQSFTVYSHGTCVVWHEGRSLDAAESHRRLVAVTTEHTDFKVRKNDDGNYLVTFKGAVGGLMSGELLRDNLATLRDEAHTMGKLPSELLSADRHDEGEGFDLIAGLYVRAQLYRDAEDLVISATVTT